jgi:DNA-binding transcriptional LysR family regulator
MSKSNESNFHLDIDVSTLRSLIAVAEEGGFTAAANRVYRTQPAVSLQISKLEERLKTKLFARTSRSIELTSAGETFLSYARRIVELADEALLAVTAPNDATLLRVGFAEYLAPQHLPKLLACFRRAHPNCNLSLVLGMGAPMLKALDDGELDVVFTGPESDGGQQLWEEPMVWTGTTNPSGGENAPIELVLMPAPCSYRQIVFEALTKVAKPWNVSIEANSVQAVQSAIQAGLGVSVLPLSAVLDDMPIVGASLPALPNTSVISFVRADRSHPYAQRFIDFLLAGIEDGLERKRVIFENENSEIANAGKSEG